MIHQTALAASTLLLASIASSQSYFAVPTQYATQNGNGGDWELFSGDQGPGHYPLRAQHLYDTADVPVTLAAINGLAWRRPNAIGNFNPAGTATLTVKLSIGPNDSSSVSSTFQSNLGLGVVTVLSGQVSLPASSYSGPSPAPYEVLVPFTAAFAYNKGNGKALVVDVLVQAFNQAQKDGWLLDAAVRVGGPRGDNPGAQPTCKFGNGNFNDTIGWWGEWYPGGTWGMGYGKIPPGTNGVGSIGTQGVGGSWSGLMLPFDMAAISAPGCTWNISIELSWPLQAGGDGWAWGPTLTIPNNPGIVGAKLYDQAVFVDPSANALGTVASWSSSSQIGSGTRPKGAKCELTQYVNQTSGNVRSECPVARFRY